MAQKSQAQSITYRKLYETAKKAAELAYAPYSHFCVGAALLAKTGEVFTGVNVENASYGAGICAERTAVVKAVSEGVREFSAIAVAVLGEDGTAYPCGICRQFLFEFSDDLDVITGSDPEHLNVCAVGELLPNGFRL